jgi:hypothetical protein
MSWLRWKQWYMESVRCELLLRRVSSIIDCKVSLLAVAFRYWRARALLYPHAKVQSLCMGFDRACAWHYLHEGRRLQRRFMKAFFHWKEGLQMRPSAREHLLYNIFTGIAAGLRRRRTHRAFSVWSRQSMKEMAAMRRTRGLLILAAYSQQRQRLRIAFRHWVSALF